MRVSLFLDLRNPVQWRRPWAKHYSQTLERIVEAERLGADGVWFTEHHFFEDGYLPQPLTFAAAAAAVTNRMRIGTAVVLAPLRHAAHIAEQAALVDIISGGRLELGLGAGWAPREYAAFGVESSQRFAFTEVALERVRTLLADGVTPPPVQDPVPLWLGYQGPRGARRAGQLGAGLICLDPRLLEPYHEGLIAGGHDPDAARMAGLIEIVLCDDPEEATERLLPHYAHQFNTYREARSLTHGEERPQLVSIDYLREHGTLKVLTVDDAIAEIRQRTEGLPVHDVFLWLSIAGMPDDLTERHLELVSTRLRAGLKADAGPPL